jgi:Flp pilus assembly protein TadG
MRRRNNGQSMVEMALMLPFLVLITMGIIEMGYYIYTYSALENATRRASEYAARTPPHSPGSASDKCAQLAEDQAIEDAFLTDLDRSDISFAFVDSGGRKVGDRIEVTIDYDGQFLTPIGRRFFGSVMQFEFTSRRTITSTSPPLGYKTDCSL